MLAFVCFAAVCLANTNINFYFADMLAGANGHEDQHSVSAGCMLAAEFAEIYNLNWNNGTGAQVANAWNSYFAPNGVFLVAGGGSGNTTQSRYDLLFSDSGSDPIIADDYYCSSTDPLSFTIKFTLGGRYGYDNFQLNSNHQIVFYYSANSVGEVCVGLPDGN